jgi:L-amino acid N-acyltransferase
MSNGAVTVRDADAGDLDAIFAIYNEEVMHGTATFDTEPRVRGVDDGWLTDRDERRHPVLVAVRGGAVVGWGSLSPWSSRGGYARTAEASVYVHAEHRGRGVGRLLLAALVERGRAAGLGVLIARIAGANAASVGLFERGGFAHIGTQRRCGEKFGRILDVELMDLHLDGA